MRTVIYVMVATAASTGCLRSTAFKCVDDTDCGAAGLCEAIGYCSFPNAQCAGTGRSFGDAAGQNLSNTCVPGNEPGPDAGVDPPIDAIASAGCPADYAPVAGSAHSYKALASSSWDEARNECKMNSAAAYLAVPDNPAELVNLATVANAPFWIGIDDQANPGTFVTQKNVPATFLPWTGGQPGPPSEKCVELVSPTEITTDKCGTRHAAVCECEP